MRITGGQHRGRLLQSPKDRTIRPTSDKVRLAVFNMLDSRALLQDAVVMDVFCGTGALGLEALSRGASCCTFMDKNRGSLDLARRNFAALKIDAKENFVLKDAAAPGIRPDTIPAATLLFLDPPYHQNLLQDSLPALLNGGWAAGGAAFVCEMESTLETSFFAACGLDLDFMRDYGDTRIALARKTKT